jgi:hypothetical protein
MFDKPGVVPSFRTLKLLPGLNQKVRGQVPGPQRSPAADDAPPAERHDLTHWVTSAERGKPVALPDGGREAVRPANGAAGRGGGRKRMPTCNGPDRGWDITPRDTGQTSLWCRRASSGSQPALGSKADLSAGPQGPLRVRLPPPTASREPALPQERPGRPRGPWGGRVLTKGALSDA